MKRVYMSGYKKRNKKNKQLLLEVGSSLNQTKINFSPVPKQQFWTEGKYIGKKIFFFLYTYFNFFLCRMQCY